MASQLPCKIAIARTIAIGRCNLVRLLFMFFSPSLSISSAEKKSYNKNKLNKFLFNRWEKREISVFLLHHNNDANLINRMQDSLAHYVAHMYVSYSTRTGTLKNDGQMSCCFSGVSNRWEGTTEGHRKTKEKQQQQKKTGGATNRRFRSNHEPQKTRRWRDKREKFSLSCYSSVNGRKKIIINAILSLA